ncbi:MAG: hypothetical protein OQK73_07975 [Gammaproteobacteria bacterium]|nr:hypothetical protein [Gammaproteobacteria bacterium]
MSEDNRKEESAESVSETNSAEANVQNDAKKPKKKIKSVRDVIIESIECEPGIDGCTANPDTCPNGPNVCDKKLSMFGYYDDTIKDSVEHVLSRSMDELTKTFTASARRWEMIVYPSMFAFILLSIYGFFLIFSLTRDVSIVADEMKSINGNMQSVVLNMDTISKNIVVMTHTVDAQSASMQEMTMHMRGMNMSMSQMRHDLSVMNHSVSKPMSLMNSFLPW